MSRKYWLVLGALAMAAALPAQDRRPAIRVDNYSIQADINPSAQALAAKVQVRFAADEDRVNTAVFDLNNALSVSKVEDERGQQIQAARSQQNSTVTLTFADTLPKGKPVTVTFTYDGHLTGNEESPVFGIKFAALHNDYGFLLYPARWFPVSGYGANRYTADLHITVPTGFKVLSPGIGTTDAAAGGKTTFNFKVDHATFPGSIAIVNGAPASSSAQGVKTDLYFRGDERNLADAYGQEFGKAMTYFAGVFGLPPQSNLTVVETESGAPNGYATDGLIFLSPSGIGKQVSQRLVANQVARQWWGVLVAAANRNHLWITNGMAKYAELMYAESANGPSALDTEVRDLYVDALSVNDVPVMQAGRVEDYSPEFWALTASKGAAVFHMLRYMVGDDTFHKILKTATDKFAWNGMTTEDFEKITEAVTGQNLKYFFLQWIESSGAPEFKIEYTIYRTQKGFRVMGKVSQDLDLFRMPVEMRIQTEGNPEEKKVEVAGTSSEFVVDTFGKPKKIVLDPNNRVLRFSDTMRVAVAIRRGEQFAELGEYPDALKEYQKALEVNRNSSLAHYRIAEVFFFQNNYQSAANEFREALNGDLDPKWTEVWAHINLGKIFDITGQRERAVNEYEQAARTKDNTQGALEEAAKYRKTPYERQKVAENR